MQDFRYALRQSMRRPGLSAAIIVMLSVGIGATTAIFSLFHQVLVQPLRVPEPERLFNEAMLFAAFAMVATTIAIGRATARVRERAKASRVRSTRIRQVSPA